MKIDPACLGLEIYGLSLGDVSTTSSAYLYDTKYGIAFDNMTAFFKTVTRTDWDVWALDLASCLLAATP